MVFAVLAAFAGIVKVKYSSTAVDSQVFRLHYRWTTTFLLACCALVVAKEHVGNPIECVVNNKDLLKPITTFCWITSTFTINSTEGNNIKGVGPYQPRLHEQTFHSYYQWVSAVLFLQACIFYLPHLLWKCYEGKQVDYLLQGLNKGLFDDDAEKKKKNIVSYLKESWGLNIHYVSVYHLCEGLNLVNVFLQMYVIDNFLGGTFMEYGAKILSLLGDNSAERHDVLTTVFPRLTKCTYKRYGYSGTLENHDALCVLPQNIVNEKIFLLMWIWFVALAVITSGWLIWRLALMLSSYLRLRLLQHLVKRRITDKVENTINSLHLGDFCLLENIGYNLDVLNFRDVLQGIADEVEEYTPSAPVDMGTYKKFHTPSEGYGTLPRQRHVGLVNTGF